MSEREMEYDEIMERLPEATERGSWHIVEAYFQYELTKRVENLIVATDDSVIKRLQGEIMAYRKILRLREDVLSYIASEDISEPEN